MKKNRHSTSHSQGQKTGPEHVNPPVELPSAEDFVCSDEEVREACEALCGEEDQDASS